MPLYFAFGSNMDAAQMARRCPGARTLSRAQIADHQLVFRGPSKKRGGGVLSVDPAPGVRVDGVLYEVSDAHLEALDRFEGAPEWYLRASARLCLPDGRDVEATIYRLPDHVEEMPPTQAYLDQVARAFADHGLEGRALEDAVMRANSAT